MDFNNLGMSMHSVAELCCFPLYVAVLSRVSQKVRDCRHTKKHLLFEGLLQILILTVSASAIWKKNVLFCGL